MARNVKSPIKKIKALKEKRDALNEQISEIEEAFAREIRAAERKQKEKEYRLIGKTIKNLLQQEMQIIIRNQQDLVNLLDKELKTKLDRKVFGLKPLIPPRKKQPENTAEVSQENLLET